MSESEEQMSCWACWQTDAEHGIITWISNTLKQPLFFLFNYANQATPEKRGGNQLIRVCNGCKNESLQFIHQDCIDKFVCLQLLARYQLEMTIDLSGIENYFCCGAGGGFYPDLPYLHSDSLDELVAISQELFSDGKQLNKAENESEKNAIDEEQLIRIFETNSKAIPNRSIHLSEPIKCQHCMQSYSVQIHRCKYEWTRPFDLLIRMGDRQLLTLSIVLHLAYGFLIWHCGKVFMMADYLSNSSSSISDTSGEGLLDVILGWFSGWSAWEYRVWSVSMVSIMSIVYVGTILIISKYQSQFYRLQVLSRSS